MTNIETFIQHDSNNNVLSLSWYYFSIVLLYDEPISMKGGVLWSDLPAVFKYTSF